MEVEVNLVGVLLAAVASMLIGSIWYARGAFGNTWMQLTKISPKDQQAMGWSAMVYMFLLSLLMAYVLAHVTYISQAFYGNSLVNAGVASGFWMWLGFVVPTYVGTGLFELRRKKLMAINLGNWLVTLLVMGAVIGYVGV